jgi:hypothetical protein
MGDLAPAPAPRISDDGGRTLEENLAARRKAVRKVRPAPVETQGPELELAPEPESDHDLDVLA